MVSEEQILERYPECKQHMHCLPTLGKKPQVLIGLDNADLIAARSFIPVTKNGPYLQCTELGWSITGNVIVSNSSVPMCR